MSKLILGIDPGTEETAYCIMEGMKIIAFDTLHNEPFLQFLSGPDINQKSKVYIEMVACYGMAVGAEVFETARWIGIFQDRLFTKQNIVAELIYRKSVKLHLCGTSAAKDANIRQSCMDVFGGKEKALGNKKQPGPLYGLSGDCWSALAICLTAKETRDIL